MNIIQRGRRFRWLLGALLVLAGVVLHHDPAHAQDMAPGVTLDAAAPTVGIAADRADLPAMTGLAGSSVAGTSLGLPQRAVEFLTNPVVAALLISLGVLLLLVELFTAGFGLAGVLGLALLAVFFWGHVAAGLAGWEGVALVAVGLVLIALEIFVIPGFGVAGILGLVALVGGLFLSLIDERIVTHEAVIRAGSTMGLAVFTVVAGGMALLWLLPRLPWLRGLVLQTSVALPEPVGRSRSLFLADVLDRDRPDDRAHPAAAATHLPEGATGVALSDLRPGGYARIGGARVDVVSRGEYIPAGEAIAVIADEGYRRVVRRADESDTGAPDADVFGVRGREPA